jgi:TolB-like protein
VRGRIEAEFVDIGEQSLKNIVRPLRAYALTPAAIAAVKSESPIPVVGVAIPAADAPKWRDVSTRWSALAAALALALIAAGGYAWRAGYAPRFTAAAVDIEVTNAPRLSIVVLPFGNLSDDKEQDYFADGITDDLTTDLSHSPDSFVISRGTAFTYKGKPVDAKQIGRELGVRYLLEGSVRRVGEKVEVNAPLISTETGAHVWADRFDGERSRLGELQVEFVLRLGNSLGVELVKAEAFRAARERPENSDADDLTMRGLALWNMTDSKDRFNEAIDLFERALSLDPHNVQAMAGLALVLIARAYDGWSDDFDRDMARAQEIVDRALMMQPDSSMLHNAYADLLGAKRQWQAAVAEKEIAIMYNRNNALAYATAGIEKALVGRADEGIADIETALRLSPHDAGVANWQNFICYIHNLLARWEKAIEWCMKSSASNPTLADPLLGLAIAHAWAGHNAEAKDAVARIEKVLPGFTMEKYRRQFHFSDDPAFNAQYDRLVEGLRKAGLPEE